MSEHSNSTYSVLASFVTSRQSKSMSSSLGGSTRSTPASAAILSDGSGSDIDEYFKRASIDDDSISDSDDDDFFAVKAKPLSKKDLSFPKGAAKSASAPKLSAEPFRVEESAASKLVPSLTAEIATLRQEKDHAMSEVSKLKADSKTLLARYDMLEKKYDVLRREKTEALELERQSSAKILAEQRANEKALVAEYEKRLAALKSANDEEIQRRRDMEALNQREMQSFRSELERQFRVLVGGEARKEAEAVRMELEAELQQKVSEAETAAKMNAELELQAHIESERSRLQSNVHRT